MDASIMTATMGFAGVVVGSVLTYLIQWFMIKRQRLWTIEDSKVQHQRAIENDMRRQRYERLRQKVSVISSQVGLKTTLLMQSEAHALGLFSTVTKEQRAEMLRQIDASEGEVQGALAATGSEELRKLYSTLNSNFYTLVEEGFDPDSLSKAWDAAQAIHRKMEVLLDDTLVK